MKVSQYAKDYVNNSSFSHFYTVRKDGKLLPAYSNGLTGAAVVEDGNGQTLETLYTDDNFLPDFDFPRFGYEFVGMGLDY